MWRPSSPTGIRGRVLVADDHEMIATLLVRQLEADGYEVLAETNPDRVRGAIVRWRPHLALLDVQMNPRERFFTLRELATLPTLQRPAVIVISGHDEPAIRTLAFQLGADHFLLKPWDCDKLRRATDTLMHGAQVRV
jgi:DNA-binding response OmpR family regulator